MGAANTTSNGKVVDKNGFPSKMLVQYMSFLLDHLVTKNQKLNSNVYFLCYCHNWKEKSQAISSDFDSDNHIKVNTEISNLVFGFCCWLINQKGQ